MLMGGRQTLPSRQYGERLGGQTQVTFIERHLFKFRYTFACEIGRHTFQVPSIPIEYQKYQFHSALAHILCRPSPVHASHWAWRQNWGRSDTTAGELKTFSADAVNSWLSPKIHWKNRETSKCDDWIFVNSLNISVLVHVRCPRTSCLLHTTTDVWRAVQFSEPLRRDWIYNQLFTLWYCHIYAFCTLDKASSIHYCKLKKKVCNCKRVYRLSWG